MGRAQLADPDFCNKCMGYDWMMENNEADWINAFFGSKEEAEAIPSLEEGYKLFHPSEEEQKPDHGYDESKDSKVFETLDMKDMKKAAAFRGGELVSDKMESVYKPPVWKPIHGDKHDYHISMAYNAFDITKKLKAELPDAVVSITGRTSGVAYPTSKFAVNGFTLTLAREPGSQGIRVNAVASGITETDMMKAVPKERSSSPLLHRSLCAVWVSRRRCAHWLPGCRTPRVAATLSITPRIRWFPAR